MQINKDFKELSWLTAITLLCMVMAVFSWWCLKYPISYSYSRTPSNVASQSSVIESNAHLVEYSNPIYDGSGIVDDNGTNQQITTMLFGGDIMLDRYVRVKMEAEGLGYPLEQMSELMNNHDLSIINLEGPVTTNTPRPLNPNNTTFTFNPDIIPMLVDAGVSVVSLANNHTRDFGIDGYNQTIKFLNEGGINYFGDWENRQNLSYIQEINDLTIGFVGYHQLVGRNRELVIDEIKSLNNEVDWVIVFAHWGHEYKSYEFSKPQQDDGYAFIDAGADLVVGAHPHVIQPIEMYRNKPIIYSLGNFIFDQQFSEDVKKGLLLSGHFSKSSLLINFIPIYHVNTQATFMNSDEANNVFSRLSESSILSDDNRQMLMNGKFNVNLF